MAEARARASWRQTATLVAAVVNLNRTVATAFGGKPGPAVTADTFDPYARARQAPRVQGSIECLKVFVKQKRAEGARSGRQ